MSTSNKYGWIGGHIHFDTPFETITQETGNHISKAINFFYLPILQTENPINTLLRQQHGYGKLSTYDWRQDKPNNATNCTYEFRLPTAEWLSYPKLSVSVIAYLSVVWEELLYNNGLKNKEINKLTFKNTKEAEMISTLTINKYTPLTEQLNKNILHAIKTFKSYDKYKKEIEYIFNYKKILLTKEKINYDIGKGWKMIPIKAPLTTLESFIKTKKNKDEIDKDIIKQTLPIWYNPDTNISTMVDHLINLIIKSKIELKKFFIFFGIKKGINEFIVAKPALEGFESKFTEIYYGKNYLSTDEKISNTLKTLNKILEKSNTNSKISKENIRAIGIPYEARDPIDNNQFLKIFYEINETKKKGITIKNILTTIKLDRTTENKSENLNTEENITQPTNPDTNIDIESSTEEANRCLREYTEIENRILNPETNENF
jgi:hypothetical protein